MAGGWARRGMMAALGAAALGSAASASAATQERDYPIVELRQYTLHDGQRDTLIGLFEREFIESQEALGMKIIGTFRDADRPNRFVWLRGFADMDARLTGLTGFYGGPVWQARREVANATMIDSDNVLLLHAPSPAAAFKPQPARPALGEARPAHLVVATIYHLKSGAGDAAPLFENKIKPHLDKAGVPVLAWFVTESAANNFPKLPIRAGEKVLVWFTRYGDDSDRLSHAAAVEDAQTVLAPLLDGAPEILRLEPTARSELR